jgi:hypothetical protein
LIPGAPSELVDPILAHAGQDVSHWFRRGDDGLVDVSAATSAATNCLSTLVCSWRGSSCNIFRLPRAGFHFAAAEIMG